MLTICQPKVPYASFSETEMLSFWWNLHHWLHRMLSKRCPLQPVMKIATKCQNNKISVSLSASDCLVHRVLSTSTCVSFSLNLSLGHLMTTVQFYERFCGIYHNCVKVQLAEKNFRRTGVTSGERTHMLAFCKGSLTDISSTTIGIRACICNHIHVK